MSDYKHGNRHMTLTTPLGADVLLITSLEGTEELSTLYSFRLELLAKNGTRIDFDKLLGNEMHVTIRILDDQAPGADPKVRHFSGICRQFAQGNSDEEFTSYQAEIVPHFWLTTRIARSRIFQQLSVPDILKKVLKPFKVDYQMDGKFEKRDYCVQYRETDYNFAARLMEEEGIFYYFRHTAKGHEMVIANSPRVHTDVPGPAKVRWDVVEGPGREKAHIHEWVKRQEVRSGKFTVWDHSFAFPGDSLEATKTTLDSVPVGKVKQKLNVANNKDLEIYDYPGDYAKWFDGVDKSGGDNPAELKKIFQENTRTAELRMQAETCAGLRIHGSSNCPQFLPGHKFHLERHPDAEGTYVLTSVHHRASGGNAFRSTSDTFHYSNTFTCIPVALPFRPQRITPKPAIIGVQTATVTGPAGQEIFVDKHARVKVQFPWDREGQHDADSSCWIRVSQAWGGGSFGAVSIPRIGHEVIVEFMEGDPDRPIITGRVYNAKNMPNASNAGRKTPGPKDMKAAAMMTSFKSSSTPGGGGSNEITMNDAAGAEGLFMKAQKDEIHNVGNDREDTVGNNETRKVAVDRTREVGNNESVKIGVNETRDVGTNRDTKIGANETIIVGVNRTTTVNANDATTIGANKNLSVAIASSETVGAAKTTQVGGLCNLTVGAAYTIEVGAAMNVAVGGWSAEEIGVSKTILVGKNFSVTATNNISLEGKDEVSLKSGASSIVLKKDGTIEISGVNITIKGSASISLDAPLATIN